MTNEDIIRMARETLIEDDGGDYYAYTHQIPHWWGKEDEIVKFAELIAAAERDACAKVCADIGKEYNNEINKKLGLGYELQEVAFDCESAIRARGQS